MLPLGSIKAEGWLKDQLLLQKNGITNAMETYPDYGPDSAWLGGSGEDWERGPYYVRGLVSLAYTLNDDELTQKAQKWIDWSIDNQRKDGFFGPDSNTDWWPRMPMLMAIRDYFEATELIGKTDERVIPFMIKYYRYQLETLPNLPLASWAKARGGDNLETIYWLYNRLHDERNPNENKWLLDLAALIKSQTSDWTEIFTNTTVREHVVNTSQAMKMPVLYFQQSKSKNDKDALRNGIFNMSIDHGRVDGLPNSDEAARDNLPSRGSELCGIVEGMLSTEIAMGITGEAWMGDRLEKMAYNSLPAAYSPDYLGHVYYIPQNQVLATAGYHEFDCDHGDSSAFGAPCGFDCCFSNNHMGWPKFVQSMWMSTKDNGLAVVSYGPNKVTAKVESGKIAVFTQVTKYPFDEAIELDYSGEDAFFPLKLRIPEWCENPIIKLNNTLLQDNVSDGFFVIKRQWKSGDTVNIEFPMAIKATTWYNNSVAIERGPLIYSLKIKEDWRELDGNDARELKVPVNGGLLNREVYPQSDWNFGLIVDEKNPDNSFALEKRNISWQPYSADTAPIVLKAKGQLIPEWTLDGNIVESLFFGKIPYNNNLVRDIELIPFGCARLRITQFPKIGESEESYVYNDVKAFKQGKKTVQEFKNVVVPKADEYSLKVFFNGAGKLSFVLNGKTVEDKDFSSGDSLIIENLESFITDESFKFSAEHYNNIRFIGNGVTVTDIEVVPKNRIKDISITSVNTADGSFSVTTNLNRDISPIKIVYGTKSGEYDKTTSGFKTNTATITGLEANIYFFRAVAMFDGAKVCSEEQSVEVTNGKGNVSDNCFDISAVRAHRLMQIQFPKIDGATSYKIEYGTTPGVYTNAVYDVIFNPYKGSQPFTADKTAVGNIENDTTYYVKMTALRDNLEIGSSSEIKV